MNGNEIPTHLNVEDKAFAGLTMRQLMTAAVGLGPAYSGGQHVGDIKQQLLPAGHFPERTADPPKQSARRGTLPVLVRRVPRTCVLVETERTSNSPLTST
jgi:hypothetical protein